MTRIIKFRRWNKTNKEMRLQAQWLQKVDGLMQFTGITDKNGKEIYEGDIVKFANKKWLITYTPNWTGGYSLNSWYSDGSPHIEGLMVSVKIENNGDIKFDLEVIGNVWENSELLK